MEANNMAMRDALKATNKFLESAIINGKVTAQDIAALRNIVSTALSSPPRNCDRPECKDIQSAMNVYRRECCEDGPLYARKEGAMHETEWLLAPAMKKKGDNDGE